LCFDLAGERGIFEDFQGAFAVGGVVEGFAEQEKKFQKCDDGSGGIDAVLFRAFESPIDQLPDAGPPAQRGFGGTGGFDVRDQCIGELLRFYPCECLFARGEKYCLIER
jgi:hypothetical protein